MNKLFGTDGLRGVAGRFPLDAVSARAVGRALAEHLRGEIGETPRLITGRDTRESGAWLEACLHRGAAEAGATCTGAGVMTTPGVAYLTAAEGAAAGVVISASHNPYQDNGIKIFRASGRKLEDAVERIIEAEIRRTRDDDYANEEETGGDATNETSADDSDVKFAVHEPADESEADRLRELYVGHLRDGVGAGLRLDGLRIVVDCANGAASALAPRLLASLGADVIAINDQPSGRNINLDCGSLHLDGISRRVVDERADLGVAFDGDADRALFCDHEGTIIDGDATLLVLADRLGAAGALVDGTVVATVMSNLGLEAALAAKNRILVRAAVGDKYVLEELLRTGASLGGEQSGHIIFPRESLVGDGMRTALHVLRAMNDTKFSLRELTADFTRYPQILVNVPVRERREFREVAPIDRAARSVEERLGGDGRLLLRYSGTELLARVMIEGKDARLIESLAHELASVIGEELGA